MDDTREDDIPMNRTAVLTERRTIPMDQDLKARLDALAEKGVDVPEWIRMLIRRELPKAEQAVAELESA